MFYCRWCGKEFDEGIIVFVPTKNGGEHKQLRCPDCNSFVKNLPHKNHDRLPFGKYRGRKIKDIARKDPEYLEQLITRKVKSSLKLAIQKELEVYYGEQEI